MDDLFLNEQIPYENGASIKVVGVGGAGGNAVANMISANVGNVDYIAVNTDAQALRKSGANTCILISKLGLGAGGRPEKISHGPLPPSSGGSSTVRHVP